MTILRYFTHQELYGFVCRHPLVCDALVIGEPGHVTVRLFGPELGPADPQAVADVSAWLEKARPAGYVIEVQ